MASEVRGHVHCLQFKLPQGSRDSIPQLWYSWFLFYPAMIIVIDFPTKFLQYIHISCNYIILYIFINTFIYIICYIWCHLMFHLILYYPPIIWSPFTELEHVQGTFPGDFPCQPSSEIQHWIGHLLNWMGKQWKT